MTETQTPREHTPWEEAQATLGPGRAVVFWRPGCGYCHSLRHAARQDPRLTWVNIWSDSDAAAHLRAVNRGDELVPTALVGDSVLRNPTYGELSDALGSA